MIFDRLQIEKDIRLRLDRDRIFIRLGYKKGTTELTQKMVDLVEETIKEAGRVMVPRGAYLTRRIKTRGKTFSLAGSEVILPGSSMQELLKNSFAVLFMAVTIGPGLDDLIARYSEEKQFEKTLILDAVGSEEVESAASALNDHLLILARQARATLTRRFSPGYGDLPLQFQAQLYKELALTSLGISIDERFFLWPRKTVTALLGVER